MNFILIAVLFVVLNSSDSSAEEVNKTWTRERGNADRTLLSTLYRSKILHSPMYRFKVLNENEMPDGWKSQSKNVQDFYALRDLCLQNKQLGLFEDPEFDAVDSSIYYDKTKSKNYSEVVWLRPPRITKRPNFIFKRATRFDFRQGRQGDSWFMSVVADLRFSMNSLFSHIVPPKQYFDTENYCGIFHFRFWQVGHWVDVVIDDRLPTINGELIFAESSKENEYWGALLEKAYAKLYGSYDALDRGEEIEAMEDLTGGVAIIFDLNKLLPVPDMFQIMRKCIARQSIITVGKQKESDDKEEIVEKKGLPNDHAYKVIDVQYVNISFSDKTNRVPLVQVRNLLGQKEWDGPWSDHAEEWYHVSKQEKDKLKVRDSEVGEYWMAYKDFVNIFDKVSICMINPSSILSENQQDSRIHWEISIFRGEWIRRKTAAGCSQATLYENPQYQIVLKDPDDDSQLCTIFIGLMQESQRALRNFFKGDEQYLSTGIVIYKVENSSAFLNKPFDSDYIQHNKWFETSRFYQASSQREVTHHFEVPPGIYRIIPCTQHADAEAEFILRVVTEKKNKIEALYI